MTHGSAFRVVGQAVVDAIADRPAMDRWRVRYSPPVKADHLLNPSGAQRAVWVDPEGVSTFEIVTAPNGWQETGSLALVFQAGDERGPIGQETVDEVVDEAVGELVELIVADPRLSAQPMPAGWAMSWVRLAGTERDGGSLKAGRWRVVVVDLTYQVSRC
jgi:hypothetical protein